MTETGTEAPPPQDWEEGVSLASHILVLIAWWREIILGVILAAGGGGALALGVHILLPNYEASADVAIVRMTPRVAIDDTLRTTDPTNSMPGSRVTDRDRMARRAAVVGLVHSGNIARVVVERLSGLLDENENEAALIGKINAELITVGIQSVRNSSDLIRITASADSPEKAAALANTWAEEYANMVNKTFEQVPPNLIAAIEAELVRVQKDFDAAQENMETFIAENKSHQLVRQINEKVSLVHEWFESRKMMLAKNYKTRNNLVSILDAARGLRAQIKNSGETSTASNRLAILLLKIEAYTLSEGPLEIDFDNVGAIHANATEQGADVDAFITALQDQLERLQQAITHQYQSAGLDENSLGGLIPSRARNDESMLDSQVGELSSLQGSGGQFHAPGANLLPQIVTKLEEDIRLLEAEKEKTDRMGLELSNKRDLLFASLKSLQSELVELALMTTSTATSEVRLATEAVQPNKPSGLSPRLSTALGGVIGLLAMVSLVFLANSVGARPFLQKQKMERQE